MLYESAHVRVGADDGTATLWLDFPGDPPNLLSAGRMADVGRALDAVRANPFVEILVVRSAKPAGFCAGYDPDSLLGLTAADGSAVAAAGQRVTAALADAPFVTLVLLDGPCRGAGLELALACDYRLAVAAPTTDLGFPEVANGFVPGWGGVTRLTRLVGVRAALAVLLSGRPVPAREAKEVGLVDHAFTARRAKIELRTFLDRLQRRPDKPVRRRWDWLGTGPAVRRAAAAADSPAAAAVVRAASAALGSEADGLAAERREFAAVVPTPEARAGLTLLGRAHRPAVVVPAPRNPVPAFPGVVGFVGGDPMIDRLTTEVAGRGGSVVIERESVLFGLGAGESREGERGRGGEGETKSGFSPPLPLSPSPPLLPFEGRLTSLEAEQAAARVRVNAAADRWAGFDSAGLVVVADGGVTTIPEVEAHVRPRAVVAVVERPVGPAQELADRPGRFAGLAFPATDDGNLVEVVAGPETAPDAVAALAAWVRHLGFVPVVVSDHPQQVVRRVLAAAWDEAARLVADGVPIEDVDRAAVRSGFGRGPLAALDDYGLGAAAAFVPRVAPLVAAGLGGRGAGGGFYHDPAAGPPRPNDVARMFLWDGERMRNHDPIPHLGDRLALRAVNAAAAALGDQAHAGPAEVDLAVALGAGLFRPHGGPFRFADAAGLSGVVARLQELARGYGRRFVPHPELARRAAAGERFHDDRPAGRARAAA